MYEYLRLKERWLLWTHRFVPLLKNNREKSVEEETEILRQTVDSIIHDVMQPQDMYVE